MATWRKSVVSLSACLLLVAIAAPAQTFTSLHSFDQSDGQRPEGALMQAADANLYGETSQQGLYGGGTIYRITPGGQLTTVYNFCALENCLDSSTPSGGLIQAADGSFYGTTEYGGDNGRGTVFRMTVGATITTLYSFCPQTGCADGDRPEAGLAQGGDGNFYGTTGYGGDHGFGALFRVSPGGAVSTIYSFCSQPQHNCEDGTNPYGGVIAGTDGNLYGTTHVGGPNGSGTVFKVTPRGTLTTLYRFCSQARCADGSEPQAGLFLGADGSFYGTTEFGGLNDLCVGAVAGCGTAFKITPDGSFTSLYSFCSQSGCADGWGLYAGLVQATDGDFYGTTYNGGPSTICQFGCGTLFRITSSGTLTTLLSFDVVGFAGQYPSYGALFQATNGKVYGTTEAGGFYGPCYSGCGTVFGLSLGLGPFVELHPTSATIGRTITVLGTKLTGATSVNFNGTAASFTVESPTAIKTTVPTGATTGPVQVVTPSGTLTSNVNFQVLP